MPSDRFKGIRISKTLTILGGFFMILPGAMSLSTAAGPDKKNLLIVALGDSTTAGTPFFQSPLEFPPTGRGHPEGPYAYWMTRKHPEWTVLNSGINGERSDEIRNRFDQDVSAAKPTYVIILAGVNDIYQEYPTEITHENLLWMYRRAKTQGILPIAASVLPFGRATPDQSQRIQSLNAWIQKTAQTEKIPFADLHSIVADPHQPDQLQGSPDGLHPDIQGYHAMGDFLTMLVEGILKNAPSN